MAFRPSDVIGVIWHHPILSLVVLLFGTPPLFPIVVYFSPLLISTALFVLAMISLGSNHADNPSSYNSDAPFKRVWIEEVDVDGPLLDGERVPKRLKAASSSKDERWFDKVKNWEGTGRAWVESVLSQEARKSVSSDDSASKDESIRLLDKAKGFFVDDRRSSKDNEYVPKTSSKPIDDSQAAHFANDSAPASSGKPADSARPVESSEITPKLESEDELIEISPARMPPSPLFRSKSLPKVNDTSSVTVETNPKDGPAETLPKAVELAEAVPGAECESGKKIVSSSEPSEETSSIPGLADNSSNGVEISSEGFVSAPAKESNVVPKEAVQSSAGEIKPVVEAASFRADRNLAESAQQTNVTPEADHNGEPGVQSLLTEVKSDAELPTPPRPGQQHVSCGAGGATPSAAVALSEKLKVPLEDIMSLLVGEDKENAPNEGLAKSGSSSSVTTTTSHEEEWSSSDVESSTPLESAAAPSIPSAENDHA